MKMQKSLMLALTAGCAVVSSGYAQDVIQLEPVSGHVVVGNPISDRALANVYSGFYFDCPAGFQNLGLSQGGTYVMDDINFAPGPWGPAYAGARDVTAIKFMCQSLGWTPAGPTVANFDVNFAFYEPGAFSNVPMLSNPTPIGAYTANISNNNGNFGYTYPTGTPISLGTNTSVWVSTRVCLDGTNTRMCDAAAGSVQPTGQTGVSVGLGWTSTVGTACVGSSTASYGRDTNNNDLFEGAAAPLVGGAINANDWRTGVGTSPFTSQGFGLEGDVVSTTPTPDVTICNISDTQAPQALAITSTVKWVKICTANAVTDNLSKFLNIDTEGSADDLAMGLYDNGGTLLAFDADSGSGTAAQLTFGLGRAAAVGDGEQYDGRDGQLTAAGDYYLAVGPAGTSFAGGFSASPGAAVSGGPSFLNFATNVNGIASLPTAVAPVPNHFDFTALGTFTFPGAGEAIAGTTGDNNPGPEGVLWSKFVVDAPGAAGSTYLDIDMGASYYVPGGIDNVAYLFNSVGDLVAYSDDQSTNTLPALSFGAASPARNTAGGQVRAPGNDPAFAWAGQNGALVPDTYYLALAPWPTDSMTGQNGAAPTIGTGRRWHVRGLGGDDVGHTADFYTGTAQGCDSIDFNNDTLFPDTLDIDDFLSVFSGGPCSNDPLCGDIDFNNDTLFPDTLDIDALLSVFSGGACLI